MTEQTPTVQFARPPNHSLAAISLIASIAGLTIFPTAGSIIGVVTGHMARRDIRAEPERYGGGGVALAGVILGWIGIGAAVLGMCVVVLWIGGLVAFSMLGSPPEIFSSF